VTTHFIPDSSTATLISGNLTVTADNAIANGTATNAVQAKVTDANGNPVPGITVNFLVDNGATIANATATSNAEGITSTTLTSLTAGAAKITATVNETSQSVNTVFTADGSTATLIGANLTVTADNAIANGTATNAVQAKVTDANGNPVPGVNVSFRADNGATIANATVTSNTLGIATTTLTSITTGNAKVTATVNETSQSVNTVFIADGTTATLINGNLAVTIDNAIANGVATNAVQAKVTDANGNSVPGITVKFSADNGGTIANATVISNAQGMASTTLTSITAGAAKVTATVKDVSQQVTTTFIPDDSTATLISGNLKVTVDSAVANGAATNAVEAKVTDANGNSVPGITVSFQADNGATIANATAATNAQGIASTTLTSIVAGTAKVTATVNETSQNVNTVFIADVTTARIVEVKLDDATEVKIANGVDFFTFSSLVKDAKGNPVPNAAVNWSQNKGSAVVLQAESSQSDSSGKATNVLTSTTAEALEVQVSAALTSGSPVNADKKVAFKAQLVQLKGKITNGVNNTLIANAAIKLYRSASDTTPAFETTSGSNGTYAIADVPQGTWLMKVTRSGFSSFEQSLDIQDVTVYEQNAVLSPDLNGKAARVILTWSSTPLDLDSYLWVPAAGAPNSLIKVNYQTKEPAGADANLDVDARQGYGPETITISSLHPGVYCYVVNRYTDLPQSYGSAVVKLYLSDGTNKEYKIESATPTVTNMLNWTVFKLDTTEGDIKVIPTNTMSASGAKGSCA
jgi:adhesin/invasin